MIGALAVRKKLGGAFEALNRHDLQAFIAPWREDAMFVYPGDVSASGSFEGKAAVEAWFGRFFEQFPTIRFDVQNICMRDLFALTGTNVAIVHWNLHVVNRGQREGRNSGLTVVRIERGWVVHAHDFIFDLGDGFRRNWSVG